jgi:hypothetical protein
MFHKNIKLIIAGLLITGIWQFTENNIGNGIYIIDCDSNFSLFQK